MPKSLYIDPNEVRRPKEHKIKFPEIPVMQYKKSVADELKEKNFTKEDLLHIYRDMFTIREFETMLNLVKTTTGLSTGVMAMMLTATPYSLWRMMVQPLQSPSIPLLRS